MSGSRQCRSHRKATRGIDVPGHDFGVCHGIKSITAFMFRTGNIKRFIGLNYRDETAETRRESASGNSRRCGRLMEATSYARITLKDVSRNSLAAKCYRRHQGLKTLSTTRLMDARLGNPALAYSMKYEAAENHFPKHPE
ncbi:hypothetical protein AVEN_189460-1 [Araneus ventricosus]|uniref:Uncharacterized protein n=1 Tax=Araneus ventricosus TaxID=182803 RepID=A0A4Y2WN10_ARAVE|nr:hypothetical protein AVEN_189460-1 [Araneus ventricosus]